MAVINLNEYTSGDFITIKEYPAPIYNNEIITFTNYDIQSFKIWITPDGEDAFGPCRSGCHFKTGTSRFYGNGMHCNIIVVDLRDKSFSHTIKNIERQYFVEDSITQKVSFYVNTDICYSLNAITNEKEGRFSEIEHLVDGIIEGKIEKEKIISIATIENKIIEHLEKLLPVYINEKVNEHVGVTSFSQLSSLITNIKNECHELKKYLSEKLTFEISQEFSCLSVRVNKLDIIIPQETTIEHEANRFAQLARDARVREIQTNTDLIIEAKKKLMDLCFEYIAIQIKLPQEQMNLINSIYTTVCAAGGEISSVPALLENLQNLNTTSPINIIEMTKMVTTQLGLDKEKKNID